MNRCAVALMLAVTACVRKPDSTTDTTVAETRAPSVAPSAPATTDTSPTAMDTGKTPARAQATGARSGRAGPAKSTPSAGDTVRGIVAVTGTEREKHVVIKPAGGGRAVTLSGPEAATVARAAGADVWISGTRDAASGGMNVVSFVVRSVDGAPATDGKLALDGGQLVLVTSDGARHVIAHAPPVLRDHIGARVWISGDLSKGPSAWGIITDKR